jgi:hypothetical protein
MTKATKVKLLTFSLPNKIGLLSELTSFLTAAGINIEGIQAYGVGEEGRFVLLTDNNAKAGKLISYMGAEVKTEGGIAVELQNKAGQLQRMAKKISDAGLDISYVYGSPVRGKMTVILKTADDKKALRILNKA